MIVRYKDIIVYMLKWEYNYILIYEMYINMWDIILKDLCELYFVGIWNKKIVKIII